MEDLTPDERRENLRRFMKERNLKVSAWCKRAGIKASRVYNFLRGDSASIAWDAIVKLAAAENVPAEALFKGRQDSNISDIVLVTIKGEVQAGVWVEATEWGLSEHYEIAVPDTTGVLDKSFGLVVRGTSMNREYPEGTILVCVNVYDLNDEIKNGDHVIVERRSVDGLIEATCKEFVVESQEDVWLWPRSTDPKHQTPIHIMNGDFNQNSGQELHISAVVMGSYRPRKR